MKLLNWLEYFDAIYCINLKDRKDRRKKAKKEIKKIWLSWKVIFFDAIKNEKNWHIWCLESHKEIVRIAKRNKYKNILVFEDDIKIIDENIIYLQEAINELKNKKWSIFYLWCTFLWKDLPCLEKNGNLYRVYWWRSTHAIAYNKSFFEVFLKIQSINTIKKYGAIDVFLSLFGQQVYEAYMPINVIAKQDIYFSSIENKKMNLDPFIMENFIQLKLKSLIRNRIIKIIRKAFLKTWVISNRNTNMFNWLYKIYHDFPKKIHQAIFSKK